MGATEITGKQIKDGSIQKKDLDIVTTGQAVIRKVIAGSGISLSWNGADEGTGDVTISATGGSGGGSGITTLNSLTTLNQSFAAGTSGTDFNISSSGSTHTFNLPNASASSRGLVTTGQQTFAGRKLFVPDARPTSDLNYYTMNGAFYPLASSNGTRYNKILSLDGTDVPLSLGVTDSGYRISLALEQYVDTGNFAGGTLAESTALWARTGSNGALPSGTITNAYAVKAEVLKGPNVTHTNAYGFYEYSQDSNSKNYMQSKLGLNTTSPSGQLHVVSNGAAVKGLIVQGAASQAANLFELQDNSAAAIFAVDSSGTLTTGTIPAARVTGLTTGITSLNALTGSSQTFAVGTSGTDFSISSSGSVHTFNIPDHGNSTRGLLNGGSQNIWGDKTFINQTTFQSTILTNSINNLNNSLHLSANPGFNINFSTGSALRWYINFDGTFCSDSSSNIITSGSATLGSVLTNTIGNNGASAQTIGTTTSHDLSLRTNNTVSWRINPAGTLLCTTPSPLLDIGDGSAVTTGTCAIRLGNGRNGNGISSIDLIGDTTFFFYGLRLIRNNGGANANSSLIHRGTGNLQLTAQDEGTITFATQNTTRWFINSSGILSSSTSNPILNIGDGNVTTGNCELNLGNARTGNGYSLIDLVGDTTYTDYGFRIIRDNSGPNTSSRLLHRGTGSLQLVAQEAGNIVFQTNNATRWTIDSTGVLSSNAASPLLNIGDGNVSTGDCVLQLGNGRTASGRSFIDLVGDTTYTDYGLRITRDGDGANTSSRLLHRGTGSLQLVTIDAGDIVFGTNNTARFSISSDGFIRASASNAGAFGFDFTTVTAFYSGGITRFTIASNGNTSCGGDFQSFGTVSSTGTKVRNGVGGSHGVNFFNIDWTGSAQLWIDFLNVGTIQIVSDYRVKRNVITQTDNAIDRIKQIRPITYQKASYGDIFFESDEVCEGFIAHELAEVIPSAVEGEKDAPNQIQSLKLDALCSVLVKAVQELTAKVEQLENRLSILENNN